MKAKLLDILETMNTYIPKLINATDEISEKIDAGDQVNAFNILNDYIEGLAWVIDAINAIQSVDGSYLKEVKVTDLNEKLLEMEEALKNKDNILLSDLLQYEIKEDLTKYSAEVVELKRKIINE